MNLKAFGERLQTLRKRAGMSQERLAEALDELTRHGPADDYRVVDATLLSRWENARSHAGRQWKPTRPYLLHLIHIFKSQLTAESAGQWADEAGYQLAQADFDSIFQPSVAAVRASWPQQHRHNQQRDPHQHARQFLAQAPSRIGQPGVHGAVLSGPEESGAPRMQAIGW